VEGRGKTRIEDSGGKLELRVRTSVAWQTCKNHKTGMLVIKVSLELQDGADGEVESGGIGNGGGVWRKMGTGGCAMAKRNTVLQNM